MNGLQSFLMGIVLVIIIIIIIVIVIGSISYSQYMACAKNVAILFNCSPAQANTFLQCILKDKITMTTYKNICKIAADATQVNKILEDIEKFLLKINISDYQKIMKALDVSGIEKSPMPRRAVSLQSTPIPSRRPLMNYKS